MTMHYNRSQVVQGCFLGGWPRISGAPSRPGAVQAAPRGGSSLQVPPAFLAARPAGGRPLPPAVQRKMEAVFGTSFAEVRVHVGPHAASLGALAFTHGSDLYFAPGQYNPDSPHGQRLLGHELAHVVQQRTGRVRNPFGSGIAVVQDPALEAEAERMGLRAGSLDGGTARRMASPEAVSTVRPLPATPVGGRIQPAALSPLRVSTPPIPFRHVGGRRSVQRLTVSTAGRGVSLAGAPGGVVQPIGKKQEQIKAGGLAKGQIEVISVCSAKPEEGVAFAIVKGASGVVEGETVDAVMLGVCFRLHAFVIVRGDLADVEKLKVGFVNLMIKGERSFFYAMKKTKLSFLQSSPVLDGSATSGVWYEAPKLLEKEMTMIRSGTNEAEVSVQLTFEDRPNAWAPLADPRAESEAMSLIASTGKDLFALWLVLGDENDTKLHTLQSMYWAVDWTCGFDPKLQKMDACNGGLELDIDSDVKNPPPTSGSRQKKANQSFQVQIQDF